MKNFSVSTISRKKLLGGTALVAVAATLAAVSVTGYAANVSTDSTWRGTGGNLNNAAENNSINFTNSNSTVTVTITETSNLPAAVNGTRTTNVGDITSPALNSAGNNKAILKIENDNSSTNNLTVKIKSVNINDDMNVYAQDGAINNSGKKLTVNVNGATNITGDLKIENKAALTTSITRIPRVVTTLNGNTTVGGETLVRGGQSLASDGASATLNIKGPNNTFNGAVTVRGGANNAANKATLNLYGASTDFKAGVQLKDQFGGGQAHLNVKGNVDQTIKGDITGALAFTIGNEGTLTINNNGKIATFKGAIGTTASSSSSSASFNRLALVQVGAGNGTSTGANAVFEKNVTSNKFEINASAGSTNNSSATFKGDLNVTDTTDGLKLNDDPNTTSKAIAIFNGAGDQTVNAKITLPTASNGRTVIKIQNTGGIVRFRKAIGSSTKFLGEMEIISGAKIDLADNAFIQTVKGGGTINFSDSKTLYFVNGFGSSGSALTVSVDANKTAKLHAFSDKTAYTNITLKGSGATLELGRLNHGAVSVTGNVTTLQDSQGILKIVGTSGTSNTLTKITGNIGEDGKALKTLDLGSFRSEVTGNVYAKTIAFSTTAGTTRATFGGNVKAETSFKFSAPGHQATFNGTGPQTITGAITANTDGDGRILVSNTAGIVTFKSAIGEGGAQAKRLADVRLNATTQIVFDKALHTKRLNSLAKKITFNEAGSSVADNLILRPRSEITLGNGITNGKTVINLGRQTTSLKDANVKVNMPSSLKNGQSIRLLKGNGVTDAKFDDNSFKIKNTALFSYTAKLDATNKEYKITATKKSTSETASSLGVKTSSAKALSSANTAVVGFSPVADSANKAVSIGDKIAFTALNKALNAGGGEAKKAAEQLNIQADMLDAGATAAVGTGTQVMSVASSRLATLRTGVQYAGTQGDFQSGFAGGDEALSKATWLKPFGSWVKQNAKGDVAGYDADTGGIALGIDAEVSDGMRLGTSFAYSTTKVTGKGEGKSKTDVKSYQWTVYADHTTDDFYVEGMLGYAVNSSKSSRRLTFGGLNRTAKGDYDSTQYMAGVGGGMPMQIKTDLFVTPMAGLSYTRVSSDSYTETGAGNLNLKVKPDDVDVLIASLGAKAHTHIKQGDGILVPSARAGLSYDFMADQATATGTYTGGGAAFKVKGMKAEKLAGNFGLGLAYDDGAWSVGANYDAEVKSGYTGHSASLEARVKF